MWILSSRLFVLLLAIKKIDPAARIIMISSMGIQQKIIDAARAGAKNFIIKPFQEAKVIERVKKALEG